MPVRAELDAGRAGEHPHPALGQAVRRVARHRPVLVHRRDVDDPAAVALGDHLLGGDLGPEEGALEVDLHHLLVLRLGGVEDRRARLDAGVVDHDVEPAEGVDGGLDEPFEVLHLADVGLDADRLVAQRGDLLLQLLRGLLVGDVVDDDVGAVLGEGEHDGLADAAVAAGDDGDLAGECAHEVPPSVVSRCVRSADQPRRSARCSPTRMALAIAVRAGFTAPMLGKKLVSTT